MRKVDVQLDYSVPLGSKWHLNRIIFTPCISSKYIQEICCVASVSRSESDAMDA
jgi:hypothetical protein